ncbi:hypothetical protein ACH5RR_024258 [Cinchona calisaya]|uniref:Integrase catalytic domain-containing protein n=1 Tax=Cinchona calisaya TaxID=153742 RepID=A0ABD2YY91_9GENT
MTSDSHIFSSQSTNSSLPAIHTANGSTMHVSHISHISTSNISIPDTFLILQLKLNLVSVGQLCDLGLHLFLTPFGCSVQDPQTGQILGIGRKVCRLFELINLRLPPHLFSTSCSAVSTSSLDLWHSRLGHVSIGRLKTLVSQGSLGFVKNEHFECVSCQLAKHHTLPFNKSDSVATAPFDLVHSDIWGPSPTPTIGGSKYFVIFVNDYSQYTWIYFMNYKSDLSKIYRDFATMIQTQLSSIIKVFRTDNAMEYKEKSFLDFLHQNGTVIHRSCPGTSQQNGRAERKHRHILDTTRALLISSSCL